MCIYAEGDLAPPDKINSEIPTTPNISYNEIIQIHGKLLIGFHTFQIA